MCLRVLFGSGRAGGLWTGAPREKLAAEPGATQYTIIGIHCPQQYDGNQLCRAPAAESSVF